MADIIPDEHHKKDVERSKPDFFDDPFDTKPNTAQIIIDIDCGNTTMGKDEKALICKEIEEAIESRAMKVESIKVFP